MSKGVLLDLSGVLYVGETALPGAADAVAALRRAGLAVRFLTNSTRSPRRVLLKRLTALGFDVEPAELFTPAAAACNWLAEHGYAPHLLVHDDLVEDFAACSRDGPKAVVVGDAGTGFTYDRLNAAFRLIMAGAPFLALAANRVFLDADGELSLDAGAFVKALEFSTGVAPIILGKPAREFFAAAAASADLALNDMIMIGDDAEADISGALAAGAGSAFLVRTGKYRAGDETRVSPPPTAVHDDLQSVVRHLLEG